GLISKILKERQGKCRRRLRVIVERDIRESLFIAPYSLRFRRNRAPVFLQQNRQCPDWPPHRQPSLKVASKGMEQGIVGFIPHFYPVKRLREEYLLPYWS